MAYGTANVDVIQSSTAGTPPQFNDGNGTQTGTLCRAWVNFDGTTSPGTIRASFNVSSVTKNTTGDYTANFTTALTDANYSAVVCAGHTTSTNGVRMTGTSSTLASGSVRFFVAYPTSLGGSSAGNDEPVVSVQVFR